MKRILIALVLFSTSAAAEPTRSGNTLTFPPGHAFQVERAWPQSGVVCEGSNSRCDLSAGTYKWNDWTSGSEGMVTIEVAQATMRAIQQRTNICSIDEDDPSVYQCSASCPVGTQLIGVTECDAGWNGPVVGGRVHQDANFTSSGNTASCVANFKTDQERFQFAIFGSEISIAISCL